MLTSGSAKLKQFAAGSSFVVNKRAEKATIDRLRDAFLIFLHVYAQRHTGRAAELVQSIYMFIIREHARRFSGMGWRKKIDKKFRICQTISCQRSSKLNSDLWLRLIAEI